MGAITVKNKKYQFYCVEQKPAPCGIVIFGASGDLTRRKVVPALWNLFRRKLIPDDFFILGCSRSGMDDAGFRERMREALKDHVADASEADLDIFIKYCHYEAGLYDDPELYRRLTRVLNKIKQEHAPGGGYIFYLATPPNLFKTITENLHAAGLTREDHDGTPFSRIIIEKPFGHDLESARALDRDLHSLIPENQIYRIDHYLGKETVQNIMMLRFANMVFEPIWNHKYIDNIQITAAESVGVEHRAGYYDQSGCLRDMFQNHMLQMLALVAMEAPNSFDADQVRDEKVKLLRAIRPFPQDRLEKYIIRGQYTAGENGRAYREEEGVAADSITPTYVAARVDIDNWRWRGVPFYLCSGKSLSRKLTRIAITFQHVPYSLFGSYRPEELPANVLVLNVQPEEGFSLSLQAKHPGPKLCMSTLDMSFHYQEAFGFDMPDAYERLILDCMQGDQTLFIRSDTLEASWNLFTPVLEAWADDPQGKHAGQLHEYAAGSRGPEAADLLLAQDNRQWHTEPH